MFLFGVTGGIGSGKSTVCALLRQKGVAVIEADPLAKELAVRVPEIRQALIAAFGPDIYTDDDQLNRAKLGAIVFSDAAARQRVNAIIHPHVLTRIAEESERLRAQNQALAAVEAALIFESGMDRMLDAVAVVTAPEAHRLAWLKQRSGLSETEIRQRINAQMPQAETASRADYVIENDGSLEDLARKVEAFYDWLQGQRRHPGPEVP